MEIVADMDRSRLSATSLLFAPIKFLAPLS